MKNLKKYQNTVLDLVSEDDYGLWEIDWAFRTDYPELGEDGTHRLAHDVVREMIANDLVKIYRRLGSSGSEEPISGDEVDAVLSEPKSWDPKFVNETHIRITATDDGMRLYYE